jgi:hypothetical protein
MARNDSRNEKSPGQSDRGLPRAGLAARRRLEFVGPNSPGDQPGFARVPNLLMSGTEYMRTT